MLALVELIELRLKPIEAVVQRYKRDFAPALVGNVVTLLPVHGENWQWCGCNKAKPKISLCRDFSLRWFLRENLPESMLFPVNCGEVPLNVPKNLSHLLPPRGQRPHVPSGQTKCATASPRESQVRVSETHKARIQGKNLLLPNVNVSSRFSLQPIRGSKKQGDVGWSES